MSALQRGRRSSSKTAPETGGDATTSNGVVQGSNTDPADPSSTPSTPPRDPTTSLPISDPKSSDMSAAEVLSVLPAASTPAMGAQTTSTDDVAKESPDDLPDNRSSSLSELGDASDEHSEPTPRATTAADLVDNDSEAETERLDQTPRKLTRTGTNASLTSEHLYERTPSKLAHSKTADQESSPPHSPTPSVIDEVDAVEVENDGNAALRSLSFVAASEAASLELAGKKRKRSSAENSSNDEAIEEPARKRSGPIKDIAVNGGDETMTDGPAQVDVEEELDNAEERISQLAQEEIELEERQANVAVEAVEELATVAKLSKPRKGGRRGKRKNEDPSTNADVATHGDVNDGDGDAEHEEEDGAVDEEVLKKRSAIDELAKIEKKFKIFREKLCDEQIAQCEQELEMLKQPNCQHPEYLAMIQCIDDRRAGKIAYEKQLMDYKKQCLERTTIAERHQLHSQYFQTVRDVREDVLSECNQRIYELQRGRRQYGVEEIEYAIRLPEKRSEQIRQQTAYNLEVSILSGVAKHVGFPAAPELKPARPSEVDDDFRAMKITPRSSTAQSLPYVRSIQRNAAADEAAAEEQFIERTPWANPQHPAHQQAHYQNTSAGPSRVPSQTYQTPAGQRRVVDIHAPNGSASTIEINSNPPSSNTNKNRATESESPVLQMKRHPSDHTPYSETPASQARNLGAAGRDSYANNAQILSSPAGPSEPQGDEHGGRWNSNGIRPMNPGASSVASRQVPMPQRNTIGAMNAQPLYGR